MLNVLETPALTIESSDDCEVNNLPPLQLKLI